MTCTTSATRRRPSGLATAFRSRCRPEVPAKSGRIGSTTTGLPSRRTARSLYRGLTAGELPVGPVSDVEVAIVRDEAAAETVYELAIPWQLLEPIEADDGLLSLSLQVHDNDRLDRKGWISWSTKPIRLVQ